MERYDADGTRRPLEPGEVAELDQRAATFRQLRNSLLALQARTVQLILADDREPLSLIQQELYETLFTWYTSNDGANEVFNLVMFLINDLAEAQAKIDKMGNGTNEIGFKINEILRHLNEMADTAGMIPEDGLPLHPGGATGG